MIAVLVSILLTRVLGDDRFHLLRCTKRPKGKVYVFNVGINENWPYLPLKLVHTTLLNNEAHLKYTSVASLTIV